RGIPISFANKPCVAIVRAAWHPAVPAMEYLMFVTQALAATAGGGAGAVSGIGGLLEGLLGTILPFALIFINMYFLVMRPQRQKQRQHQELIANVRRGDTVVTSG